MDLLKLLNKFEAKNLGHHDKASELIPEIYKRIGEKINGWALDDVFEREETRLIQPSAYLFGEGYYTALHFIQEKVGENLLAKYCSRYERMKFILGTADNLTPKYAKADSFLITSLLHRVLPDITKYINNLFKHNKEYPRQTCFEMIEMFNCAFCQALFYTKDLAMHLEIGLRMPKKQELLI